MTIGGGMEWITSESPYFDYLVSSHNIASMRRAFSTQIRKITFHWVGPMIQIAKLFRWTSSRRKLTVIATKKDRSDLYPVTPTCNSPSVRPSTHPSAVPPSPHNHAFFGRDWEVWSYEREDFLVGWKKSWHRERRQCLPKLGKAGGVILEWDVSALPTISQVDFRCSERPGS